MRLLIVVADCGALITRLGDLPQIMVAHLYRQFAEPAAPAKLSPNTVVQPGGAGGTVSARAGGAVTSVVATALVRHRRSRGQPHPHPRMSATWSEAHDRVRSDPVQLAVFRYAIETIAAQPWVAHHKATCTRHSTRVPGGAFSIAAR